MRQAAVLLLLLLNLIASVWGADKADSPRILGVAQMSYYVSDLAKARSYYEDFLGFQEAFRVKTPSGADAAFVKINDHQFIELIAEPAKNHGFLYGIGFETNDASGIRSHLASLGIKVPDSVGKDPAGNLSFEVTDPFGFDIQIIQYQPGSQTERTKGRFTPESRISTHIDHVGLLVGDRDEAAKFYGDAFGFVREGDGTKMKIADSPDRFELGFERKPPTIDRYHVKDHICLSVPDVPAVTAKLSAKPAAGNFREIENHQLGNGKHVAELYDLDGNRVELMEPPKTGENVTGEGSETSPVKEIGSPSDHSATTARKSNSDKNN